MVCLEPAPVCRQAPVRGRMPPDAHVSSQRRQSLSRQPVRTQERIDGVEGIEEEGRT